MATWKQIEQRRETRLWITQVFIPIAGLAVGVSMIYPDIPKKIKSKATEYKEKIETKFKKQEKEETLSVKAWSLLLYSRKDDTKWHDD